MVISIQNAVYQGGYRIALVFSDGTRKTVDFENFLQSSNNQMTRKYLNKELFRSFVVEYGDLVWNDYEMCFPIWDIYQSNDDFGLTESLSLLAQG